MQKGGWGQSRASRAQSWHMGEGGRELAVLGPWDPILLHDE